MIVLCFIFPSLLGGFFLGLRVGLKERSRLHEENFELNLKANLARDAFRSAIGAQAAYGGLRLVAPTEAPKDDGVKN